MSSTGSPRPTPRPASQRPTRSERAAIASKLIWTDDYAASRLGWKKRDPLWVLALRVHRLLEPVTVAWDAAYGGCTSWVELQGLPDDPASLPSEPALSDVAFAARLKGSVEALPALAAKHPSIGEARGLGLFWGLELVKNRETREMLVPFNAGGEAAAPVARLQRSALEAGGFTIAAPDSR